MKPKFEKKTPANWAKIGVVLLCVLFAVAMVISYFSPAISALTTSVTPGQYVTFDFTVRDALGRPVLTSNQQVFKDAIQNNQAIYYANRLEVVANSTSKEQVVNVPVYVPGYGWTGQFALFSPEYDSIAAALVGMKTGGTKTINLPKIPGLVQSAPAARFAQMNVSLSSLKVNQQLQMGVASIPESANATLPNETSFRIARITQIGNDSVIMDSGYPTIEVTVVSVSRTA